MPDTELLTDQQIAEIEARKVNDHHLANGTYIGCYIFLSTSERDSLIATVKQLRHELANEKRLRAELKQIAQTGIAEVSSVGTTLGEIALRDFRSRAVDLCNQKAAECDAVITSVPDQSVGFQTGKATAFREIAAELEKLT